MEGAWSHLSCGPLALGTCAPPPAVGAECDDVATVSVSPATRFAPDSLSPPSQPNDEVSP